MSKLLERLRELERLRTPGEWRTNKYGSIGSGEYGTDPIIAQVEPFYGYERRYGNASANRALLTASPSLTELAEALEPLAKYAATLNEGAEGCGAWISRAETEAARTALANLARRLNVAEEK